MKPKPTGGTGMLSAAGLTAGVSGTAKPKALSLAPPPTGAGKIRSPLPPPPNDPAAARMTSTSHQGVVLKGPKENVRHSNDPLSDLSPLEVCLSPFIPILFLHMVCFACNEKLKTQYVCYDFLKCNIWQFPFTEMSLILKTRMLSFP